MTKFLLAIWDGFTDLLAAGIVTLFALLTSPTVLILLVTTVAFVAAAHLDGEESWRDAQEECVSKLDVNACGDLLNWCEGQSPEARQKANLARLECLKVMSAKHCGVLYERCE